MDWKRKKTLYVKPGRLEDVLALIQVLAMDQSPHRSEDGVEGLLQRKPRSGQTWTEIAKDHHEFFRVVSHKTHPLSLVSRVINRTNGDERPPLAAERTQALLSTAIELHDRQLKRSERWTLLLPLWTAVIGGIVTLVAVLVSGGT